MENNKPKVLFIAGSGRSGTTILHNILDQIDGFSAIGELRYLWERGLIKNKLCGCNLPVRECQFWQDVMTAAFGGLDEIDAKAMSHLTESFRIKDLPLVLVPGVQKKEASRLHQYLKNLEKLYHAIQATTGSRVIVDSSKNPSYGYLLQLIPSIELYVLHFTRDSQAVAYSWSKVKEFQAGDKMARKTAVVSALQWNAHNLFTQIFMKQNPKRYLWLRYEAFVENPQRAITTINEFLGESSANLPFVSSHTVQLKQVNHSVFGNPVRFQQGLVTLRLDDKWQTKMNKRDKLAVKALTWPLRRRYGYP
jgi:hypothetical protein